MDLENQEGEVELNEPVETIVDEVATEEVVADEIDDDAEITGDDALAILAGEDTDETPAEEPAEETVEVVEEEVTAKTPEEEESEEDAELLESITNERTRERFQSLSHRNKELIEASEQQTQVIDAFKNQVTSTGLSNEDFTQVIGLMGKANSPDMNSVKEARAFIRDLDKTLTERIGDTPDAYSRFDDLKKDYEDGELSEEWANKEAQRRIQEQAIQQQSQQQSQQVQVQEQAVMQQANTIESMVQQFKTNDPDFSLKEAQLQEMTTKIVADGVPMEQWASEFVNRYHTINVSQRKPSPAPMSSSRQAQNVNNFASANVSDEQANYDFAMSLTGR